MHETQAKLLIEELTKMRKACEGINEAMQKLLKPMVSVTNVLSQQELDSLKDLPPGPIYANTRGEHASKVFGLRNQASADRIRRTQEAILLALQNVDGKGFSLGEYRQRIINTLVNTLDSSLSHIQVESTFLTYSGNSIEAHWENQAGTEYDRKQP